MNDQNEATDEQRRAVIAALLQATVEVNAGKHPGQALRDLLATVRGIARPAEASAQTGSQVALRPEVLTAEPVVEPARRANPYREAVIRIFDHWRRQLDHATAKLTPERATKVQARLREGYTEEDVIAAIDGCANSPFHRGENDSGTKYDDLTLICRSGSVLEKFRDLAGFRAPAESVEPIKVDAEAEAEAREIRQLEFQAKALLKAGKVTEYNDAVRSIRDRKAAARVGR